MPYYKKVKQKVDGKYYPRSITVGKPVTTDEVAERLAAQCTVTPSDTFAVLKGLGGVLADYMTNGRTVKLDGVGTFYYTANASGKGVATEEEVNASQITNVRVRFIPEYHSNSSHKVTTRSLVNGNMFWEEWGKQPKKKPDEGGVEDPTA